MPRRFSALVVALLGFAGAVSPGFAAEWQVGEATVRVDTTLSVGASIRVEERDCQLSFLGHGGCNPDVAPVDDGNLNDQRRSFASVVEGRGGRLVVVGEAGAALLPAAKCKLGLPER